MKSRHLLSTVRRLAFGGVLALVGSASASANSIWYVKPGGAGAQTGVSWANAFPTVQQGINQAATSLDPLGRPDEVWVAEGTYFPPIVGVIPTATSGGFVIMKPIKLYGGFKGTETSVAGRHGSFKKTILEGDINNTSGLVSDDALHVVIITGVTATQTVVIDGFQIQHSYATGAGVNGGGVECVKCNLDLFNCFMTADVAAPGANYGGGVHFTSLTGGIEPTVGFTLRIKSCEFTGNAGWEGGAIYVDCGQGDIVNTKFVNSQSTGNGAAVYLARMGTSNLITLSNCLFDDNFCASGSTASQGAGLYLGATATVGSGGSAKVVNCTFVDNSCSGASPANGQALALTSFSQAQVYNSIFYYNNTGGVLGGPAPIDGPATVTYSDVEYGWIGTNNLQANPSFVNYSGGNFALSGTSPCLDAADYSQLPGDTLDLDGDGNTSEILPLDLLLQARCVDQFGVGNSGTGTFTYLDMGAYERQ
jgi:hypothetical protein